MALNIYQNLLAGSPDLQMQNIIATELRELILGELHLLFEDEHFSHELFSQFPALSTGRPSQPAPINCKRLKVFVCLELCPSVLDCENVN